MSAMSKNIRVGADITICKRRQPVNQIVVIRKGVVRAEQNHMTLILRENDVFGTMDSLGEGYLFDYITQEETELSIIPFDSEDSCEKLLQQNPELQSKSIFSAISQMCQLGEIYDVLDEAVQRVYDFTVNGYQKYILICKKIMIKPFDCEEIANLSRFEWGLGNSIEIKKYFIGLNHISQETLDSFFNTDINVISYHIMIASQAIKQISRACEMLVDAIDENLDLICSSTNGKLICLYEELCDNNKISENELQILVKAVKDQVTVMIELIQNLQNKYFIDLQTDVTSFKKVYEGTSLIYQKMVRKVSKGETIKNVLEKLLDYSEIDRETARRFQRYIEEFRHMPDKYSLEDNSTKLRKKITEIFYKLYELIFLKSEKSSDVPEVVSLFLDYGLVDERLVEEETVRKLLTLEDEKVKEPLCVYTMRQWLHEIYTGRKEPSKNEFNIDYTQQLYEIKKKQELTKEQEKEYLEDKEQKIHYEIENMFKINCKITYGHSATFCPVLKQEDITGEIEDLYITGKKINEAVKKILLIDFSAFHREYMYDNRKVGIHNLIMKKQVFPDVILMPNAGCNGSMWQEITGRKRDTPGRFILPQLTREDVYAILLRLCGMFRWEMCKTMQGNHWNDIREKSLTSEYFDYVQFYKKNKELSEMAKDKIALQLQKCRNSFREMFVMDYIMWIMSESAGSIRMNKVARGILATYCPFAKIVRNKLEMQPIYVESAARFERERARKMKELSFKRASIRNGNGEEPKELIEELRFYEEL